MSEGLQVTASTHGDAPKSFTDMPNEIVQEVYQFLPLGTLQCLQRDRLHPRYNRPDPKLILRRRFKLLLDMFVASTVEFASTLTASNSIISGSCALWMISGPLYFTPNDMDVYTASTGIKLLLKYLVEKEGYVGIDEINRHSIEFVLEDELENFATHWRENAPAEGAYRGISGVRGFIKLAKGDTKVDILLSKDDNPTTPIRYYHSTLVSNWIQGEGRLCVMYRRLTLKHVFVLRQPGSPRMGACLAKYRRRGFHDVARYNVDKSILHNECCICMDRTSDDQFTETISFDGETVPPAPLTVIPSVGFSLTPGRKICRDWGCSRSKEYEAWTIIEKDMLQRNTSMCLGAIGVDAARQISAIHQLPDRLCSAFQKRPLTLALILLGDSMYKNVIEAQCAYFNVHAYGQLTAKAKEQRCEVSFVDANDPCLDYLLKRLGIALANHKRSLEDARVHLIGRGTQRGPVDGATIVQNLYELSSCLTRSYKPSDRLSMAVQNFGRVLELTELCQRVECRYRNLLDLVAEILDTCREPMTFGLTSLDGTAALTMVEGGYIDVSGVEGKLRDVRALCGFNSATQ